jgi:hypothetical protein
VFHLALGALLGGATAWWIRSYSQLNLGAGL